MADGRGLARRCGSKAVRAAPSEPTSETSCKTAAACNLPASCRSPNPERASVKLVISQDGSKRLDGDGRRPFVAGAQMVLSLRTEKFATLGACYAVVGTVDGVVVRGARALERGHRRLVYQEGTDCPFAVLFYGVLLARLKVCRSGSRRVRKIGVTGTARGQRDRGNGAYILCRA